MKPSPPSCTKLWMPGKVTRIVSKHTVCVGGMPCHVTDIRKQRSCVSRDSRGHLQVDDLRDQSAKEAGGVPFVVLPREDEGETSCAEQTNDREAPRVPQS